MLRRLRDTTISAALLILGIILFWAATSGSFSSDQKITGIYFATPSELTTLLPPSLSQEETKSIERLLHCTLRYQLRDDEDKLELTLTIPATDNRPLEPLLSKAVDLTSVILKRHLVAGINTEIHDLRKFQDGEPTLAWLHSRRDLLKRRRELTKNSFELREDNQSPPKLSTGGAPDHRFQWLVALATLTCLGFAGASARSLARSKARNASIAGEPHDAEARAIEVEVGAKSLDLPCGTLESPLLQALCDEVANRENQVILVLGDSGHKRRTDFVLKLTKHLSNQQRKVRLVDFDLKDHSLSTRLGREHSLGVGDYLVHGGPPTEFYSSLSGLDVEFAPSGQIETIDTEISVRAVREFFSPRLDELLLIDACNNSPLHLIINQIKTVLYVDPRRPEGPDESAQSQVLLAFREARLPVWAVTSEHLGFFPML